MYYIREIYNIGGFSLRKLWVVLVVIVIALMITGSYANAQVKGSLLPAPAIFLPYGSDIKTEINFSDQDVLGFIKTLIPMISEYAPKLVEANKSRIGNEAPQISAFLNEMDTKLLQEAISGVKNIRVVIADYKSTTKSKDLLAQFEKGVTKTGTFSKFMTDSGSLGGTYGIYKEANSNGYIAYMYDPNKKEIYAARLIGFLDYEKITRWGMEMALKFSLMQNQEPSQTENIQAEPATPTVTNDTPPDEEAPEPY